MLHVSQAAAPCRPLCRPCLAPKRFLCRSSQPAHASAQEHPLVNWLHEQGGSANHLGVSVSTVEGRSMGLGLVTTAPVRAGDVLIDLPLSCHLTYDPKTADPQLLTLIDQVPDELWGAKLALQVLSHRAAGAASPFATYIEHLPVGIPGVPAFYPGQLIDGLQYPPVVQQVKKRCRWMYDFATGVLPGVGAEGEEGPFGGTTIDINALGWGLAVVTSRAFRTRGPKHPAAMLPLVDMCNHDLAPSAEIKPAGGGGVHMVATRDLAGGEALLLNYGPLSNDFLLMDYGFILPDNPHDTVELSFDLRLVDAGAAAVGLSLGGSEGLAPAPWQAQLLAELGFGDDAAANKTEIGAGGVIDTRLLGAVRVLCASSRGELSHNGTVRQLRDAHRYVSTGNECKTLRVLAGVMATVLSSFPTTLEEDAAALAACEGDDEALMLGLRVGKKRILHAAIQRASDRIKTLSSAASGAPRAGGKSRPEQKTKARPASSKGFG